MNIAESINKIKEALEPNKNKRDVQIGDIYSYPTQYSILITDINENGFIEAITSVPAGKIPEPCECSSKTDVSNDTVLVWENFKFRPTLVFKAPAASFESMFPELDYIRTIPEKDVEFINLVSDLIREEKIYSLPIKTKCRHCKNCKH